MYIHIYINIYICIYVYIYKICIFMYIYIYICKIKIKQNNTKQRAKLSVKKRKKSELIYRYIIVFPADPEELCAGEGLNQGLLPTGNHNALLQRAQAAEERARLSEEALARAMDDLHKLR